MLIRGTLQTTPLPDGGLAYQATIEHAEPYTGQPQPSADAGQTPVDAGTPPPPPPPADAGQPTDAGPLPPPVTGTGSLGWNTNFTWSGEISFADKMKLAERWKSGSWSVWDDGRPLDLDDDGWLRSLLPDQHALTLVPTHNRSDDYVVTWEGNGTLLIRDVQAQTVDNANHEARFTADPGLANAVFRVTAAPIRNMKVYRVGEPAAVWDPLFIKALEGVRVIRTMQWARANDTFEQEWSDRPTPTYFTQKPQVAWEYHIALCNFMNADCWLTLPIEADDDYFAALGALVRDNLAPGLRVYVEYSNEIWNGAFKQYRFAATMGRAAGIGGSGGSDFDYAMRFQGRRSQEMWEAFSSGFGAVNAATRMFRVIGIQNGNRYATEQIYSAMDPDGLLPQVLAIAPYVGSAVGEGGAQALRDGGVDYVFNTLMANGYAETLHYVKQTRGVANDYGLTMAAYEGGQHLVLSPSIHNDAQLHGILLQAQRDPRMGAYYQQTLNDWTEIAGLGAPYCHYTLSGEWNKWGYWGATNRTDDLSPIKYQVFKAWGTSAAPSPDAGTQPPPDAGTQPPPPPPPPPTTGALRLDLLHPQQTIKAWSATAQAGQIECSQFESYRDALYQQVIDELGITRVRVELRSGSHNDVDSFQRLLDGEITFSQWLPTRYTAQSGAPYQWAELDHQMTTIVEPLRALDPLLAVTLTFVDFGPRSTFQHRNNPAEYAAFMMAAVQRLQTRYGVTPTGVEVILEHDQAQWSVAQVQQCLSALRARLDAAGLNTVDVLAPSSMSTLQALQAGRQLDPKPDVLVYHRYANAVPANVAAIAAEFPRKAMLEYISADLDTLWDDLTVGNVEAWQQFAIAFCEPPDGSKYYLVPPATPAPRLEGKARWFPQVFRHVRPGMTRYPVLGTVPNMRRAMGFAAPDGRQVYVVQLDGPSSWSMSSTATWQVTHTTNSVTNQPLPAPGGQVSVPGPAPIVVTVSQVL